jgi:hypothetical protein
MLLGALPLTKTTVRSKRKRFDQMSVYGRRRGLRDLRGLFKIKEVQYQVPVSRLAGFIINQVGFTVYTPTN